MGKKERRYLKHCVTEHRRTELELARRRSMTNFRSDFAFLFNRYVASKYIDDIKEWHKIFCRNNTDRQESIKYNLQT
jgi:hypothetical protein